MKNTIHILSLLLALIILFYSEVIGVAVSVAEGGNGNIRVGIADGVLNVNIISDGIIKLIDVNSGKTLSRYPANSELKFSSRDKSLYLSGKKIMQGRLRIEPLAREVILKAMGRQYNGRMEIILRNDGLLSVVNEVDLEKYLAGTLKGEISPTWKIETIKAQAVVARTYTIYHMIKNKKNSYHISGGQQYSHQQYAGRIKEETQFVTAIKETEGEVLTLNGDIFAAFYHTDCGGWTENAAEVFASSPDNLIGIKCDFCISSPHHVWKLRLNISQIRDALVKNGYDTGEIHDIISLERSQTLRIKRLQIKHSKGNLIMKGTDFRRIIGYDTLRSTLFSIVIEDGIVNIEGRGWGHGVGMCQWGAKSMGERGYTYKEILQYYFPKASLSHMKI